MIVVATFNLILITINANKIKPNFDIGNKAAFLGNFEVIHCQL